MERDSLWPAVTFLVLYTGLLFAGFGWIINSQITPIKELLTNHITDTNKKIEKLTDRFDNLTDRFDNLTDRFDKQGERFDRLYELLLKEKTKK